MTAPSSPRTPSAAQGAAQGAPAFRWLDYTRRHRACFIVGPLLMLLEVIGEITLPRMIALIIDYGIQGRPADAPRWIAFLYRLFDTDSAFVVAVTCAMIGTVLLMMLCGISGAYFGSKASVNFAADLRADMYRRIQHFSYADIDRFHVGSLVTRLTNDVAQIQMLVNLLLRLAIRAPAILLGATLMALTVNPRLSVVIAMIVPVVVVGIIVVVRLAFSRFREVQANLDHLNNRVRESVTDIRVVKSFVREGFENDRFAETNRRLKRAFCRAMTVMITASPFMTLCANVATLSILWFGGRDVSTGAMTVGNLTLFVTYIQQILNSLMMITVVLMNAARAIASAKRIREVMTVTPSVTDEDADPEAAVTEGEVVFDHVSFRYFKDHEEKILDDIQLTIPAGSTVGIIGATGSGKTTLVSLVPRLYDPDEGRITIDGRDVRDYSLRHLRDAVGVVLQKNVLFSGSIADNLRWGDSQADEPTIRKAASAAEADGFVEDFPDGYEHDLGQGGTNVSGGQKQRLCIARALLKNPKILILDDALSAVDTATEAKIRGALREECPDTTKIIIAQRILSVMDADRIVVLNQGRVEAVGTHQELIGSSETYRQIYELQMENAARRTEDLYADKREVTD